MVFRIEITLLVLVSLLRLRIIPVFEISFIRHRVFRNLLFKEFGLRLLWVIFHVGFNRENRLVMVVRNI